MSDLISRLRDSMKMFEYEYPRLEKSGEYHRVGVLINDAADSLESQAKCIAELEAEVARVQSLHEGLMKNADQMNDALRAERDALKVDAGRWKHLRAHSTHTDRGAYSKPNGDGLVSPLTRRWYHDSQYLTLDTLDAAIDAAIKEQQ